MAVGSNLLAYLNDWISGCSFLTMVVMCWWNLKLPWIIIPSNFACSVSSMVLLLTLSSILGVFSGDLENIV